MPNLISSAPPSLFYLLSLCIFVSLFFVSYSFLPPAATMAGPAGMKLTAMNGVKVYTVSGHRQFASWLPPNKKKALRKDQG